jgi:hypothetical protein
LGQQRRAAAVMCWTLQQQQQCAHEVSVCLSVCVCVLQPCLFVCTALLLLNMSEVHSGLWQEQVSRVSAATSALLLL